MSSTTTLPRLSAVTSWIGSLWARWEKRQRARWQREIERSLEGAADLAEVERRLNDRERRMLQRYY